MFIVGIFSWWYGAGWAAQGKNLQARLTSLMDYFSIELLVKTLFSPFRQIAAGRVGGPIADQLRAFADRLISRCIGAMVRSAIIIIGVIVLIGYVLIGSLFLLIWPIVPIVPLIGAAAAVLGWIPWSN